MNNLLLLFMEIEIFLFTKAPRSIHPTAGVPYSEPTAQSTQTVTVTVSVLRVLMPT